MQSESNTMYIIKRNGKREQVEFDKITIRNNKHAQERGINVDSVISLSKSVINGMKPGMTTRELDALSCENAICMSTYDPEMADLALDIAIDDLHKETPKTFKECIILEHNNFNKQTNKANPLLNDKIFAFAMENIDVLESVIDCNKDFDYDYNGFKILEKSYLQKSNGVILERPQYALMRVALGIHGPIGGYHDKDGVYIEHTGNIDHVLKTYQLLSSHLFTHASPTLFYSGTPSNQLSSCYILHMSDSLSEIFDTLKSCGMISKYAGGIGISLNIRCKGSYINSTNGISNGLVPLCRMINEVGRYVDQCLEPNSLIFTANGVIPIKEISCGDRVLTADGTFQRVLNVKRDSLNDIQMYCIGSQSEDSSVWLTGEHPFYAIQNSCNRSFKELIGILDTGLIKPDYIEAKNITYGDYIGTPVPTFVEDIACLSEDDCEYYGVLYGSRAIYQEHNHSYIIVGNEEGREFAVKHVQEKGGKVTLGDSDKNGIERISIVLSPTFLIPHIKIELNRVIHKSILHLPLNKIQAFLRGAKSTECIDIHMPSINYLCNKLYPLETTLDENGLCDDDCFLYKGMIWTKVDEIQHKQYSGTLIDLNVENNENYVTSAGLVHNGGGKRKGAISIYLDVTHPDLLDFLELRSNRGDENLRARDIFPALWIPDLFFKRLTQADGKGVWSFFCPSKCPDLYELYGDAYEAKYLEYEEKKMYESQESINNIIMPKIITSLTETGMPYMHAKDHHNRKTNHQNMGTIYGSNLCVSGDTPILTDKGYIEIKQLAGTSVNVWNGSQFSESRVEQTGTQVDMIEVETSDGCKVKCTPYHKFILKDETIVEAKKLKIGDELIQSNYPFQEEDINNYQKWFSDLMRSGSWEQDRFVMESSDLGELLKIKLMCQTHGLNPCIDGNALVFEPFDNIKISSIKQLEQKEDSYCFNEPLKNRGMFGGLLLGNCSEISQYHTGDSISVCNLSSIALPKFVTADKQIDWKLLGEVVEQAVYNLCMIHDKNFYPVESSKQNNQDLRPMGLGVQGLADMFALLELPWEDPNRPGNAYTPTLQINRLVFECIYYHAIKKSTEMARIYGPYKYFEGSPVSQGKLQYHMWGETPLSDINSPLVNLPIEYPRYDWDKLTSEAKLGVRNSLMISPMPTNATSGILANTECFEAFTSMIFVRKGPAGSAIIVNKHLYKALKDINLWTKEIVDTIIANNGSVQAISVIPEKIRLRFKTIWELPQKIIIDMAAARGPFIDQSQSMNVYFEGPTAAKLSSLYVYGWKKGLKTLSYYVRSRPSTSAVKITLMPTTAKKQPPPECTPNENGECELCGS